MKKTEKEMVQALEWAGVPEMPEELGKDTPVWIYAIARVMLHSFRESWVIVRSDYGRDPKVIQSFCDSGIAKILSVHPYKFLDRRFMPELKTAAETKAYIARAYGVPAEEVAKLKKEDMLRLFYSHCIKAQLQSEKEETTKDERQDERQ